MRRFRPKRVGPIAEVDGERLPAGIAVPWLCTSTVPGSAPPSAGRWKRTGGGASILRLCVGSLRLIAAHC